MGKLFTIENSNGVKLTDLNMQDIEGIWVDCALAAQ